MNRRIATLLALGILGCGGAPRPETAGPINVPSEELPAETAAAPVETPRQPPPAPGPARDVHLPPIARVSLASGLEVNTVTTSTIPVAYARFVVRSGLARDPANRPGLARLVAAMLEEGTARRTSERLAEDVESIGGAIEFGVDADALSVQVRAPSDQFSAMLEILADVVQNPAFREADLRRVKDHERNRLQLESADPSVLGRRHFFRLAYPNHPYGHIDFDETTLGQITRDELVAWHRANFVPSNAFLVVAGAVDATSVQAQAERVFARFRGAALAPLTLPELPARTERTILVVHRPGSVQSVITIGNPTIPRVHPDFVALDVANQILGGSAASRLFMDLRERRSLTYGAYSSVDELVGVSPFRARAAVPNARTEPAIDGFLEHLHRIVQEEPPAAETADAERYLSDSFPLQIDTIGRIAFNVAYLRLFGLPDDYWDSYRSQIRAVTPAQALAAARAHIRPDTGIMIVVGDAAVVAAPLARLGRVEVVDTSGNAIATP